MGLTKQYLRYVPGPAFGIVGTGNSISYITRFSQTGKYAVVGACENIFVWDLRRGHKVITLNAGVKGVVTSLVTRPPLTGTLDHTHVAAGYSDGTVALFDTTYGQPINFCGHKGAVNSLAWDNRGMRVASGSTDGEIVIWDVVSERGVVRLKGHKGLITKLHFLKTRNILVSSSKDSFIKFWDLDTNHCFYTLAEHRAEVWDFIITDDDTRLIAGSSDANLRVWSLNFKEQLVDASSIKKEEIEDKAESEPSNKVFILDKEGDREEKIPQNHASEEDQLEDDRLQTRMIGRIERSRGGRVLGMVTDGRVVASFGKGTVVDLYVILNEEEIAAKVAKRLKKARKRARKSGSDEASVLLPNDPQLCDEIHQLPSFRTESKISGIDLFTLKDGTINILTLHSDNSIYLFNSSIDSKESKDNSEVACVQVSSLQRPAHRTEVRAVSFNSMGDEFVTASGDSIKLWHRSDNQVKMTVQCEYALSLIIPPGDRHALIGTKSGRLQLYDLGSGSLLEDFLAHEPNETDGEAGIYSLSLKHDKRGFASGGTDCMVKFWNFELVDNVQTGRGKRLSFLQDTHALKVADQVTCVQCSRNGKFVAVATLDLKETLYYADTLKLCHELYGKSMPSTCMDFTDDATIVVTGSKDSCIRIYGTDFGDMRKMIKNGHQGGVTSLQFVPKTHYFFSCGHDGSISEWDADNFERIVTLKGHSGIVRCLAVSPKGDWVVSSGQDRSIRLWEKTQEPLVLEEEREDERQLEEDQQVMGTNQRPVVAGEDQASAVRPTLTSHESEKAVDQLMEALAIFREYQENEDAKPHYLMTYVYKTEDPLRFVLLVLRKIKSSEIEEAILVLPFDQILDLLVALKGIIERDWDIELAARVLSVASRVNMNQLIASQQAAPTLRDISHLLPTKLQLHQDLIGFNLAGLRMIKDRLEMKEEVQLFAEAAQKLQDKRKTRRKKERTLRRALLTL